MKCLSPVAIITGATSGLGAAMARRYVEAGAKVVAVGRDLERLADLEVQLGTACIGVALDVADATAVGDMLASLPEPFAKPTVLINNAGVWIGNARAHDAVLADWDRIVDTNIRGVLHMTHAILPGMVERDYGDVVNMSSIAATLAFPTGNVYGASKAFVRQFTLNLRADLLGCNIRAICIEPGTTRTGFAAVRLGTEQAANNYRQANLMEAQDVADVVHFCTSLPRRVNVNLLEMMPISQAFAAPANAVDMPVVDG